MSVSSTRKDEMARERQRLVDERTAEDGSGWAEKFAPGTLGCHELVDRAAIMAAMVDSYLVGHPACIARPDWYALANQAAEALHQLYQRVAAEHV